MKSRYYTSIFLLAISALFFLANFLFIILLDDFFASYVVSIANNGHVTLHEMIMAVLTNGGYIKQFPLWVTIVSSVISVIALYFSWLNFALIKEGETFSVIFTKEYWLEFQSKNLNYKKPKRKKKKRYARK